jgi:hypothetical protein
MARKREILTALLRALMQNSAQRRGDFENFIASHPVAQDYAEFRAKTEREQKIWIDWPMDSRDGKLQRADFDDFAKL